MTTNDNALILLNTRNPDPRFVYLEYILKLIKFTQCSRCTACCTTEGVMCCVQFDQEGLLLSWAGSDFDTCIVVSIIIVSWWVIRCIFRFSPILYIHLKPITHFFKLFNHCTFHLNRMWSTVLFPRYIVKWSLYD